MAYCPSAKVEHEVLALLATVIVASLDGLWLVWNRSQLGGIVQHGSMTINAVLILAAATLVLYHPLALRMEPHRRSALRLFMLASGVWFFRVGLMFWIAVNGGPVGFDPATLRGNKGRDRNGDDRDVASEPVITLWRKKARRLVTGGLG